MITTDTPELPNVPEVDPLYVDEVGYTDGDAGGDCYPEAHNELHSEVEITSIVVVRDDGTEYSELESE